MEKTVAPLSFTETLIRRSKCGWMEAPAPDFPRRNLQDPYRIAGAIRHVGHNTSPRPCDVLIQTQSSNNLSQAYTCQIDFSDGFVVAIHRNKRPNRVGVYGTLKKGHSNQHFMTAARFVGRCRLNQITLYDIGPFPGAKLRPSQGIDVEVYDVTDKLFARLDGLEGYKPRAPKSGEYDRRQLETPFGPAWIYLYNRRVSGLPEIRRGGWPVSSIPPRRGSLRWRS